MKIRREVDRDRESVCVCVCVCACMCVHVRVRARVFLCLCACAGGTVADLQFIRIQRHESQVEAAEESRKQQQYADQQSGRPYGQNARRDQELHLDERCAENGRRQITCRAMSIKKISRFA